MTAKNENGTALKLASRSANPRPGSEGMTLLELTFVLMVLGGLGWGGLNQFRKLRMRVKAIEVKVLVNELDQTFDHHVEEYGLSLPVVAEDVSLENYRNLAKVPAGEVPHIPDPESETFDF